MRLDQIPPGTVAVTADEAGRYTRFAISMQGLWMPAGTKTVWQIGNDIAGNRNAACEQMDGDWIWFVDDDHAFPGDILLGLLERNVDIVAPLCLRRVQPFLPVACGLDGDFLDLNLCGEDELVEVEHTGSSGMLVRRRVLEEVAKPPGRRVWFQLGDGVSEDVVFCRKARAAGFRVHVDTGRRLGHVTTAVVWPAFGEGRWRTGLSVADGAELVIEAGVAG